MARLTVPEAAAKLGISEADVRKRVQRGQIPHERADDGRLFVWISPGETRHAASRDRSGSSREEPELVAELRDRIRSLENQLAEERDARRRADTIIAQLSQATAEQARTIRAIEVPTTTSAPQSTWQRLSEEHPEAPRVEATPRPGRVGPQTTIEGAQEPRQSPETAAQVLHQTLE
jgi:hypothetical protein